MDTATPALLLEHPELVRSEAPWCSWLDNVELGLLLLGQPWLSGHGLRRSELLQQLEAMAADLALGPIYFQRVNRATRALVSRGQLRATGVGRRRRYQTTAAGFAALILNLQVLRADPTLDGSEFELKLALAWLWNLTVERLAGLPEAIHAPGVEHMFEQLATLRVWGRIVVTDAVVADAFDVLRLIRTQRERVEALEGAAAERKDAALARQRLLRPAAPARRRRPRPAATRPGDGLEAAFHAVRILAAADAPRLGAETRSLRYRAYLAYLDGLTRLFARRSRTVSLAGVRRAFTGRRG